MRLMNNITALMNDLNEVCVADYINKQLEESRFPSIRAIWENDIIEELKNNVTSLISGSHEIDDDKLSFWKEKFPRLKMLSLAFTGYDRVNIKTFPKPAVYYVPSYATDAVAEHALFLTGAVLRKIVMGSISIRKGKWDNSVVPGYLLTNRRIGILGTGKIGTRVAELFKAHGCPLFAWSPRRNPEFLNLGGTYVDQIEDIFSFCDIITLHVKSTKETEHIVNRQRIGQMKPSSILINTGRAKLVDNEALSHALKTGSILGAGIDVFDTDPIKTMESVGKDPLLSLDPEKVNIVATPHIAFKEDISLANLATESLTNVERWSENNANQINRLDLGSIEE